MEKFHDRTENVDRMNENLWTEEIGRKKFDDQCDHCEELIVRILEIQLDQNG